MDFFKSINWRAAGLTIGGILISLAGAYVEDIRLKDQVKEMVHEEIAAIAEEE